MLQNQTWIICLNKQLVNKENGAVYKLYKMKGKGKTPTFEPLPYIFYCQAQGPLSTPGLSYKQFPQYEDII